MSATSQPLHIPRKSKSLHYTKTPRFSQLLLEYGEKALLDWAVTYSTQAKLDGRLRLCSKSLVFEPTDANLPIMRFSFERMPKCPVRGSGGISIEFECSRYFTMKARNVIAPFESVVCNTDTMSFQFIFLHSSPDYFLEIVDKLYKPIATNGTRSPLDLTSIEEEILNKPFDPSNIIHLHEQPLTDNLSCSIISPLIVTPGCIVVTNDRIYFQAAKGSVFETSNWLLSDIVATARRYHGLKDCALEFFLRDDTSVLLSLASRNERNLVLNLMPAEVSCHTDSSYVTKALNQWVSGMLSNFDYLLILNSASGRSFHDLSRYPVFPWVISDYSSSKLDLKIPESFRDLEKPIGALNDERLCYFSERMESMVDIEQPFLYGTHYSAPGYVLYYLVRSMPEHMLCLQNGKFDAPDRLFHSVKQTYKSVLTNHADVKELIPEFFDTSFGDEFLINVRNLPLGNTQLGERVHDVNLPPWARSPRDFIRKNRKALESSICSEKLPCWIDLIFGVSSRGEMAREKNNVFHKTAYMSCDDLELMASDESRSHAALQAMEFGCVPDCLFSLSHPKKGDETCDESIVTCRCNEDYGIGLGEECHLSAHNGHQLWEILKPYNKDNSSEQRDRFWSTWSHGSAGRERIGSTDSIRSLIDIEPCIDYETKRRIFSVKRSESPVLVNEQSTSHLSSEDKLLDEQVETVPKTAELKKASISISPWKFNFGKKKTLNQATPSNDVSSEPIMEKDSVATVS